MAKDSNSRRSTILTAQGKPSRFEIAHGKHAGHLQYYLHFRRYVKRPNALILEIAGMVAMEVMQLQQLWYTKLLSC